MNCQHCGQPLNVARFNELRTKKSCPSCSQKNGKEHVFYNYPKAFGTTPKRASTKNPDGPQSYCTPCRGEQNSFYQFYLCSEVIKDTSRN